MKYATDNIINAALKNPDDKFNVLYEIYDGYFEQFLADLPCQFYIPVSSNTIINKKVSGKWLPKNMKFIPSIQYLPNRVDIDFAWTHNANSPVNNMAHVLHVPVVNTVENPAFIEYSNPEKSKDVLLLVNAFSFLPNLKDYNGYDAIDYADVEFKDLTDLMKDYKVVVTQTFDDYKCYAELIALSLGCNVVTNHSEYKESVFKQYVNDNVKYYKTGTNPNNVVRNSVDSYDNQRTRGFRESCGPIVSHYSSKEEYIDRYRELFNSLNRKVYKR